MPTEDSPYNELKLMQERVYAQCGFELTNLKLNTENVKYGACSFQLNGHQIEHRVSKITPLKTGQFVTIWKRNLTGATAPFDVLDDLDYVVITSKSEDKLGQFIFPKSVLAAQGIITQHGKDGKRGIRVYPSWDTATNRQAEKTQHWQTKYFVIIKNDNSTDFDLLRKLFNSKN